MAWKNKQKFLVHMYAQSAQLADQEYRDILYRCTGVRTAAHPGLTQYHFDLTMAHVEAVLDYRVSEGFVPRPDTRKIKDLSYWRKRLASRAGEKGRYCGALDEKWEELRPHLPESQRGDDYLLGIASHACACRFASRMDMNSRQIGIVITALRDRLHYAVRNG